MQQNIRYNKDGSPFIFQDFDDLEDEIQLPLDGYIEIESPIIIDKIPNIKGFKDFVKSLEIINDEEEDDDIDFTSLEDDGENVMISQDSFKPLSPHIKRVNRKN